MHLINRDLKDIFQALSDPIRIRILRLHVTSQDEACLCEMSNSLEEPDYKLSRHVKILRQAGLLTAIKDGRWIYHRLVGGVSYLDHLYQMIKSLPDGEGLFERDFKRFVKQKALRSGERCRAYKSTNQKATVQKSEKSAFKKKP